jgi:hypothetical protein
MNRFLKIVPLRSRKILNHLASISLTIYTVYVYQCVDLADISGDTVHLMQESRVMLLLIKIFLQLTDNSTRNINCSCQMPFTARRDAVANPNPP